MLVLLPIAFNVLNAAERPIENELATKDPVVITFQYSLELVLASVVPSAVEGADAKDSRFIDGVPLIVPAAKAIG